MNHRTLTSLPSRNDGDKVLAQFHIGAVNTKGRKSEKDTTVGQDNLSVTCFKDDENFWNFFCVLDGHGDDGHFVSDRGARTLPYFLTNAARSGKLKRQDQVMEALVASFELCQDELIRA